MFVCGLFSHVSTYEFLSSLDKPWLVFVFNMEYMKYLLCFKDKDMNMNLQGSSMGKVSYGSVKCSLRRNVSVCVWLHHDMQKYEGWQYNTYEYVGSVCIAALISTEEKASFVCSVDLSRSPSLFFMYEVHKVYSLSVFHLVGVYSCLN